MLEREEEGGKREREERGKRMGREGRGEGKRGGRGKVVSYNIESNKKKHFYLTCIHRVQYLRTTLAGPCHPENVSRMRSSYEREGGTSPSASVQSGRGDHTKKGRGKWA